MRIKGPRNKIARREGADLGLKTPGSKGHASLLRKLNITPGQHGARGKRKQSERGKQLREKQKLRFIFGVTDRQLKKYFQKSIRMRGNTAANLSQLLEKRLDNIVYRLSFAPTRPSARQLVSHGHIKVNGRKVNVASYSVSLGEEVSLAQEKIKKVPYIELALTNKTVIIPKWLEKKDSTGKLTDEPTLEEVEKQVDLRSVVEFFSR